jgi:hypothetical protein
VGDGPADRVLLVGNGVLHGWGVPLRGMAVQGQLAQLLYERTGRAVVLDFIGEERMNAASAEAWLGDAAGRGHDLAVVCVGLNDALRLTPLPVWRQQMTVLMDRIRSDQDVEARILLVGLPHVRAFSMADSAMGSVAQAHAAQMDLILQDIAGGSDEIDFVAAPEERFEPGHPLGSLGMYRAWAEQLLPSILPALEAIRAVKPVAAETVEAWDWIGTPAALESDGSEAQRRLDAVTESVRERYDVAMAGIHVVDGTQVFSIAGRSGGPRAMPRSLAYCDRTISNDAPTVIEDASVDPGFAGNPFLEVVGLPFYAGIPLHASDGRAVATLCVLDTDSRIDIDPAELQRFADVAEAALHSFEAPAPSMASPAAAEAEAEAFVVDEHDPVGLRLLARLLQPVLHAALSGFLKRQARPHWDNRAVSPGNGQRPLRVLVFGAGFAVGYGSDGAADPLPAQLSAALTAATGLGAIVETRARPSVPLEQSVNLLGPPGAAGFDHVVWCPTLEEATRGSGRRWTKELRRITATVHQSGSPQLRMTLLGLPLVDGDHVLQRISRVLGRQVNRRIADVARAHERTRYLPVPSRTIPDYDTPMFDSTYRSTVTGLIVERVLDDHRAVHMLPTGAPGVPAER